MKSRKKQPQSKYGEVHGCYVDSTFERTYGRKHLQAKIEVASYKGAMLLRVVPEEKCTCSCGSCRGTRITYPAAWLRGDDLDALLALVREMKRQWLREHKQTLAALAKRAKRDKDLARVRGELKGKRKKR